MRLCLLNPNSTVAMTEEMVEAGEAVAAAETVINGITAQAAPATIEGYRDEAIAAAEVARIVDAEHSEFDCFVIACFGDPGLHAAREITAKPVVGIAEASLMMAMVLGYRFAILTNSEPDIPEMEELVRRYGFEQRCAGVEAVDLGVADADADRGAAFEAYRDAGERAIATGAEVVCLGCGPMLGLRARLEGHLGAPVVEAVPAGVKLAESLVAVGLRTSKTRAYRTAEVTR